MKARSPIELRTWRTRSHLSQPALGSPLLVRQSRPRGAKNWQSCSTRSAIWGIPGFECRWRLTPTVVEQPIIAFRCMSLHGVACHCMSLHVIACHCMSLHGLAWRCSRCTQFHCMGGVDCRKWDTVNCCKPETNRNREQPVL